MTASRSAVALLAGLGALLLAPAAARAADYQVYKDAVCAANAQCGIDFGTVPAGKLMRIDDFSCYLRFPVTSGLLAVQLVLVNSNGSRAMAITPNVHIQDDVEDGVGTKNVYVGNEVVRVVGHPGQHFRAYAQVQKSSDGSVGTVSQLSCHISGTLI